MGGALTAVSPDFTRASLGVPAMNYSVLLPRSVDFDEFAGVLYPSYYPNETARPLVLDLMQMLWDRGEPDGYAAADDRPTRCPTRRPTRCCWTSPSATTRSPTTRPTSRRARSAPRAHQPVALHGPLAEHRTCCGTCRRSRRYPYTGSAIYYWDIGPVREEPGRLGQIDRHRTAAVRKPAQPHRRRPARRCRGRRRPSSSSSPTSSKERSSRATTAAAAPATRGASPARSGGREVSS